MALWSQGARPPIMGPMIRAQPRPPPGGFESLTLKGPARAPGPRVRDGAAHPRLFAAAALKYHAHDHGRESSRARVGPLSESQPCPRTGSIMAIVIICDGGGACFWGSKTQSAPAQWAAARRPGPLARRASCEGAARSDRGRPGPLARRASLRGSCPLGLWAA